MFDVGFSEIFLLAIIGLIILGPERLPAVARAFGNWVRRGRRMAQEFQRELEREVDLQAVHDLQKDLNDASRPFKEAARTLDETPSLLEQKPGTESDPALSSSADSSLESDSPAPKDT